MCKTCEVGVIVTVVLNCILGRVEVERKNNCARRMCCCESVDVMLWSTYWSRCMSRFQWRIIRHSRHLLMRSRSLKESCIRISFSFMALRSIGWVASNCMLLLQLLLLLKVSPSSSSSYQSATQVTSHYVDCISSSSSSSLYSIWLAPLLLRSATRSQQPLDWPVLSHLLRSATPRSGTTQPLDWPVLSHYYCVVPLLGVALRNL